MVAGLLTPSEVAVTCATPIVPGVQTWGLLSESHVPAQAEPLLATVTTAVLLEKNEIGSLIAPLLEFCAAAENERMVPTSSEIWFAGAKVMLAGTG
ncbi:MAG: hypothetical protein NVS1B11_32900 [Terriglobales bacterium]